MLSITLFFATNFFYLNIYKYYYFQVFIQEISPKAILRFVFLSMSPLLKEVHAVFNNVVLFLPQVQLSE